MNNKQKSLVYNENKLKRYDTIECKKFNKNKLIKLLMIQYGIYHRLRENYLSILNENAYLKRRINQLEVRVEILNRTHPDGKKTFAYL